MKNYYVRFVTRALLLSLAAGIAVTSAGLLLGWKTYTQFSDGYFWAGAIMISTGLISVFGAQSERTVAGLEYSETAVHLDAGERFKIWTADLLRAYHLMAFLGIAGIALFVMAGAAILVGRRL